MAVTPPQYIDVRDYSGDPDVPRDVQNMRASNHDVMRWMGTPVLLKRIYTVADVEAGIAQESPTMDDMYEQPTYANDQLSHGVGYVSIETQEGEWYDPATGHLYYAPTKPDPSYLPAPKYRGYQQGYLAYAIMGDRPEDVMRFTEQGTLIRTQDATVQLPWFPRLGDNDLLIVCEVDPDGIIAETYERYQLKQVAPLTLRGQDRLGRREVQPTMAGISPVEGGNRYWIGQQANLELVPYATDEPIYQVDVDR